VNTRGTVFRSSETSTCQPRLCRHAFYRPVPATFANWLICSKQSRRKVVELFCALHEQFETDDRAAAIIIPQLNDAIGVRQVRRYALTGERFDVKEAYRIGLVHEIAPLNELPAAGDRIVDHLLASGPEAIAQTKACALRSAWSNLDEGAFTGLIRSHAAKRQTKEAAEGFASFLEKRPARWKPIQKPKA